MISSSRCPAPLMQLRLLGRLSVTNRMCACGKERRVVAVSGGGRRKEDGGIRRRGKVDEV